MTILAARTTTRKNGIGTPPFAALGFWRLLVLLAAFGLFVLLLIGRLATLALFESTRAYGATNTEEHSTPDSLRAGGTTCDKPGDDAAYWQPTLWNGDTVVVPTRIHAYYRAAPGIDPTKVVAFPDGLKMLAGDPFADGSSAASVEAAGWTCGARTDLLAEPPSCPATAPLAMVLTFPDCWDGEHADVVGHRDHMTYSRNGACPSTHPVSVPQLTVSITFPISGPGHDLRLASGSVHSAHGDFFNGWDSSALKEQIRICIHRRLVCELASNRQEESLFQTR